jgi:hypothetical protein
VLNPRSKIADVLESGAGIRSWTGRLLAALGLVTVSPDIASAARGEERRGGDQGGDDAAQDKSDDSAEKTQKAEGADRKNDSDAGAEDKGTSDKLEKSRKQDRNDDQSGNDEGRDRNDSDGSRSRADSQRRNADSDSAARDESEEDDDPDRGNRRVRRFEQQADESPEDSPADRVPDVTNVTPVNPNAFIDEIPETSINDLIVQASDDVIADVSTSGGFAFARSGDVIAVSGPDGASIIQTGDVTAGTSGTSPDEPSDDGGNNSPEFVS